MSEFKQFGNPIGKGTAYTLELLTPYERKLGVIPTVLNYQYRNKVMGLNEIEFDIPAYFIIDQKDVAHPFYHTIDNGMLIQVHISGQKEPLQYIVDTVNESTDKSTEAQKHIHAFSKEYFLSRKKFLGMELAGRILYYTPDLPEKYRVDGDGLPRGVLNDIFEKYGIEITHIDESLKRKAREISIGSTNIYQFLAHLEEVFGCIFKFNGDATKVEIYDSANFGRNTGITISERNIINTFSEDTRYEDMVTRLYVYGSDEVSIASVNPTGLPYIDDFSYFLKENYLPKYLIDLYNEFAKLPKHNTELNSLVAQRNELLTKRNEAEFYLEVVRDELRQALHWAEALELREKNNTDYVGSDPKYEDSNAWNALKSSAEVKEFINAVKSNTTLTDRSFTSKNITFVSLLELSRSTDEELQKLFKDDLETLQARGGEAGWLAEIERLEQEYISVTESVKNLQKNNDFNQYMSEQLSAEQFAEGKKALDAITIEGEYINSDLDSSMLNELLEEGKKELDKMCFPKIQFTVDALDFSQLFDTQDLWNYLFLGDIIYVKTDTGFNYPVHFIGIEHSPDTASLNLQFSSSAALTDSTIFLADLIANATRANGILSMNKDSWNKAAAEASAINQQLKEGFDLAQQRLAGASKQVPILDERGFWLYALDSNENPKPEQIRAINNVIALTKDGWETIEVAITPEGINANAIVVGTMSADRVRLGRFESADKTTYWDLETNEIKIGDTFFFSPETGLEIDFQPPVKHKNLISTAEFFTEYSVSMPENAQHRFETNATTGELRLIAPKAAGIYSFYLAVDSAALTQNFTLLSDNLDMINDIMPEVTVTLANSNYEPYSNPVAITKGKGIYTITPTISSADLPLSLLQINLTKEDTTSEAGIIIPPETLALVKENVPDLTWENTVISGVSSSTVINNERIGMVIENNIENKLAALDITEDGITQRVSSSTKEYFDLNKDQLKGADGNTPYVEDGYWFINGTNTGVKAEGQDGAKGADGSNFTWNLLKGSNELKSTSAETAVYIPRTYVENGVTHYEVIKQNLTSLHFAGYRGEVLYSDLPKVFTVSFEVMLNDMSSMTTESFLGVIGGLEASGERTTNVDLKIKNIGVELKENVWQKVSLTFDETLFATKTSTFDINKIERIHVSLGQYFNGKVTFRKLMFNGGTVASNYAPHISEIQGADGAPGKDGIGITSTTIEYAVNQSGTTHPTTGWSGTVPNTNPGDYIWTKTTWNYTDGTSEDAYSVGRIGVDGPDGNDGLPGAPGVGIKMTTITYTKSNSGTVIPPSTATWSPTPPAGNPGEFIWTRTVWTYTDNTTEAGYSVGKIGNTGPQGADGVDAKLISLTASEQVFKNNTPATITVTGLAQNTSITSWTYSSNSGAFTATLPAGVTRSGNTVTITQSTMTANTLTIKASDGTYSDTVSIAKLADGMSGTDGFTVLLTNESQTFPANSSGTVTSYAGGYSDVVVYYGGTPLTCTTTATGLPTVNNTYTVTAITASAGTVTLTPSLVSSNYRVTPSALTTDNAIRVLTVVARVNNTNYTFKKTLTYAKSKSGADGADGTSSHLWIRYYSGDLHPWDEGDYSKVTMFTTESTKWFGTRIANYEDEYYDVNIDWFQWTKFVGTDGTDGTSSHLWIRYYNGDLHPLDDWDFSKFTVYPTELTKWVGVMVNPYEDTYAIGDFAIEFFTWTKFVGSDGKDGATPYIGSNGNWWINGIDTGVEADVAPIREEFESYRNQTDKAIEDRVTKTVYNGLTTRVAQAEQKLTPTSITQTVENNTTTLATKAEVRTTAENWTAKFSQVGGRNLVKRSGELENQVVGLTGVIQASIGNAAMDEYIPVTPGEVLSFSRRSSTNADGGWFRFAWYAANKDFISRVAYSSLTFQWTVPQDTYFIRVSYPMDAYPKIERGDVATEWTPHPEELYTGITTINKDGVTVGREGETIETNLGFDGVRISDGATEIASFTGSGAVINNLEAESISGDVINIMSNSMTFDIGSGTGYYADFSEVLNAIGNRKHLASGVKITINIRSVLNDTIRIEGFSGSGEIEVNIYSRVNGQIRTSSNSCAIRMYGKNTTHVVSVSGYTVISSNDAYVLFDGLNIDAKNTTSGRAITSLAGSNVYVQNCDMINCQDAFNTSTAGKLHALDTKGNVSRHAALGWSGSIWLRGTIPDGTTSGFVHPAGTLTRTPSTFSPPATKTVSETRTFNHTDIYTYNVKYGAKSTHYGKAAAQNRWDTSMTQMKGRIVFGSSVYSFISGRNSGTTPTVKMRLRRQNSSHGTSASVKPTPEWSGAPSFGGATRGNWTPWVTIPYTLFTSSGYTFSFYNGTTGNSYAIWDRAEIQITRTVTQ